MSKHDLTEYRFAQAVVKDFPKIMDELLQIRAKLKPYRKYVMVQHVLDAIDKSSESLNNNLGYYQKVLINKGSKDV